MSTNGRRGKSASPGLPPVPAADSAALRRAADAFAADALAGCRWWRSGTSPTRWAAIDPPPADPATAVVAHLSGECCYAVAPVRKSIVVDVDLPGYRTNKAREARPDQKVAAAKAVSLVLDTLGIPHLHVDSRGGLHTWIRYEVDPTDEGLNGLNTLLASRVDGFELRPAGGRAIRLPFGVSNGVERRALGAPLPDDELLAWLASPRRGTEEHLRLLAAQAPEAKVRPIPKAPRPVEPYLSLPREMPVEPPFELPGWNRWPRCKQLKLANGLAREGERHWTWLMVAAEALLHAPDLAKEDLVAIQRAVPLNGLSSSSEAELDADAWQNAHDLIERLHDGRPIRTGCPRSSGADGNSPLRSTFARYCTDERGDVCSMLRPLPAALTPYEPLLRSSIWRGGQGGRSRGLGLTARAVFEFAVEAAGAEPRVPFELTERYVEARKAYLTRKAAGGALKRLSGPDVGLLKKIDEGIYVLDEPPSAHEIAEIEQKLGTAVSHRNAVARHEKHWDARRRERDSALAALTDASRSPF